MRALLLPAAAALWCGTAAAHDYVAKPLSSTLAISGQALIQKCGSEAM
jgi:hypothetical protein